MQTRNQELMYTKTDLELAETVLAALPAIHPAMLFIQEIHRRALVTTLAAAMRPTGAEETVFRTLAMTPERLVTMHALKRALGAAGYATSAGSLWVHVRRLREKMMITDGAGKLVTVRGEGYMWLPVGSRLEVQDAE